LVSSIQAPLFWFMEIVDSPIPGAVSPECATRHQC